MTGTSIRRTVKEVLIAAKKLIKDPKHWTTKCTARSSDGKVVEASSPDATSWCAMGALMKESYDDTKGVMNVFLFHKAMGTLRSLGDIPSVSAVNDLQGHDAVMNLFDKAIESQP